MRTLLAIVAADFRERVRSYAFLVTMVVTVLCAYQLAPGAGATEAGMHFDEYRSLNNAAGIGATVAALCGVWVSLVGFYLVSGTVRRDEDTGVGQIIATTQVSKVAYLVGKMLSNVAVLLSLLGLVALTLVLTFFAKGEGGALDLGQLWWPLFVLGTPGVFLVAGAAVIADVLFRRGRGLVNVGYFFLWTTGMVLSMQAFGGWPVESPLVQVTDVQGLRTVVESMESDLRRVKPEHKHMAVQINFPMSDPVQRTFTFHGMQTPAGAWLYRFVWVPVGLALVALAAVPFRRFDPAPRPGPSLARGAVRGTSAPGPQPGGDTQPAWRGAPNLPAVASGSPFFALVLCEGRLLLHGRSRWWWLVSLGLFVASVAAPLPVAHRYLLPGLWLWHALVFSGLGSREVAFRTTELVFASPRPLAWQLPACLAAGFTLALLLGVPVLLREFLAGNSLGALGVVAGALFVPSLALALGTWSNGPKLFEVAFTLLCYGCLNGAPALDLSGALAHVHGPATALGYLAAGFACAALALPGRAKQLKGL